MGLSAKADEGDNVEARTGFEGSVTIPGTPIDLGGSLESVYRYEDGSHKVKLDFNRKPVEVGIGAMAFAGVTSKFEWDSEK